MDDQQTTGSAFLLNAKTLRLTIYACLIVGNVLFAVWYPADKIVGIGGALFFVIAFFVTKRSGQKRIKPIAVTRQDKSISVDRKS
jgi:hypothetical protein